MGTQGLVWQKRGLNPPLSFITANLMIGDERSSRVSIVLFCPSRDIYADKGRAEHPNGTVRFRPSAFKAGLLKFRKGLLALFYCLDIPF
ncbi:hypothetical protein DKZ34_04555 [Limosilactobacillus reuteri]|nr:hypothetical protein DKZ34_04555 [Limosilactobacillus reuteri]